MDSRRILLVDDEVGLRTTLAANLELEGYTVVEAGSGEEALGLVRQGRFDLVLTDIRMPGMTGVELFRQLRAQAFDIPVVLMTGFALEELVRGALEDGAFTVLAKPFDVGHALDVVERAARVPMVLIVDDASNVASSMADALNQCGLRAKAATNGAIATQALQDGNIDICVVDMVLQGKTGPEVVEELRKINPSLVVIGMSGHDVPDMVKQLSASGIHTFLRKPFRIQDLVRTIALARG